jgi:hypothetical protein
VPWLVEIIQCRNKKERKPGGKTRMLGVQEGNGESNIHPLTLDPGRHLASLDVTRLLPLDPTSIDSNSTS